MTSRFQAYDSRFFEAQIGGALESAKVVLDILFEIYRPRSVFDLGCGTGAWLAAAGSLGCDRLVGVDGPWVRESELIDPRIEFSRVDLEQDIEYPGQFDLAICVEVAEHVSRARAGCLVETLCRIADLVVFSAAVPLQGGVHHINEQWQSFWAAQFDSFGYQVCDFFRPRIWSDAKVEAWYRQNLLLYIRRSHPVLVNVQRLSHAQAPLDIVHPYIFEGNIESYKRGHDDPTLRLCAEMLLRWVSRQVNKIPLRVRRAYS